MPYFKSQNNNRGSGQIVHGEGPAITSQVSNEQRIGNAVIQDKLSMKDNALSRMTSNLKTTVIYYQQKVTGRNDYVINTGNLGSTDVNKNAFIEIKDFIIICSDALNVSLEKNDGNVSLMGDGTATVLPKTIKPLVNDHFVMNTLNKNNLYRITEVQKASIEQDSAYSITYQLVEENSVEELEKIKQNIVQKCRFIYSHVGQDFRTIFREDEYEALEKMESIYRQIGSLYNEYFYNGDKNTYILTYDTGTIKDEKGVPIGESRIEKKPWTTINPLDGNTSKVDPPKLNDQDVWYGSQMYDRMLVEFITKNNIFTNVNGKIFRVAKLQSDLERWYSKTIFYAIETQNKNRLAMRYHMPSPITRLTMAGNLNLYGTVSLEPIPGYLPSCLRLMPSELFDYTLQDSLIGRAKDPTLNFYPSMIDLICEIIGLYVNKKNDAILDRIMILYEHIDEFCDISIKDQNAFYLFPMLALIIRKTMDRLSDPNFGLAVV